MTHHLPKHFQTKLFINGKFEDAASGKTFATINPATGEEICQVAEADKADIDRAVIAARAAFKSWKYTEGYARRDLILKLAAKMEENLDELAAIEALDNGKPFVEAQGDIGFSVKVLRYYAGWADKIYGKVCPVEGNHFTFTKHQPIGVCGQIIPWNYPIMMAVWKIGPALCTGNCVILKPAEQTPLSALRLAELINEAGFPPGVVNIVPGFGATAGSALAAHMDVDKIAFTGSTVVGRKIQVMAAESNLKRVSLELGGKSPMVILDDADIDNAVNSALVGVFLNQGQVCTASSRIFVQESVYDQFVAKIKAATEGRKQGSCFEDGVLQGPLISERQTATVMGYIEKGKKEGATLILGGTRLEKPGYFVVPTIFGDVKDDMTIAREEIFGPVMSILKFKTVDEAIERANATVYGLAAAVHTRDMGNAFKVLNELNAGTVWVNTWDTCDPSCPFGGFKQSGSGRELGEYSLENYTEVKTVMWAVPQAPIRN
jgi:aldehyde dehydrogenase (NAD+)